MSYVDALGQREYSEFQQEQADHETLETILTTVGGTL